LEAAAAEDAGRVWKKGTAQRIKNGQNLPFPRKTVDKGAKCDMIVRQNWISGVEKDE
jgi:hypothetical protein